eukprot:6553068-Pyramimonas_sp.AAC.1
MAPVVALIQACKSTLPAGSQWGPVFRASSAPRCMRPKAHPIANQRMPNRLMPIPWPRRSVSVVGGCCLLGDVTDSLRRGAGGTLS